MIALRGVSIVTKNIGLLAAVALIGFGCSEETVGPDYSLPGEVVAVSDGTLDALPYSLDQGRSAHWIEIEFFHRLAPG